MASYDLHLIEEDTPDKVNSNKNTSSKDYLLCLKNPFTTLFLVIAGFILAMILSVWVGLAALPVVVLLLTLILFLSNLRTAVRAGDNLKLTLTALTVFLVICGPVFIIFLMGGVSCKQAQNATNDVNMTQNIRTTGFQNDTNPVNRAKNMTAGNMLNITNNKNITRNGRIKMFQNANIKKEHPNRKVSMFYSISCKDLDIISGVIGLAGILQLHTFIMLILAKLIVRCQEWITACCRRIKTKVEERTKSTVTPFIFASIRREMVKSGDRNCNSHRTILIPEYST